MENWTTSPSQGQKICLSDRREEICDAPWISNGSDSNIGFTGYKVKILLSFFRVKSYHIHNKKRSPLHDVLLKINLSHWTELIVRISNTIQTDFNFLSKVKFYSSRHTYMLYCIHLALHNTSKDIELLPEEQSDIVLK